MEQEGAIMKTARKNRKPADDFSFSRCMFLNDSGITSTKQFSHDYS